MQAGLGRPVLLVVMHPLTVPHLVPDLSPLDHSTLDVVDEVVVGHPEVGGDGLQIV